MDSDRELADAVEQRHDEAAFLGLYRRHTPRLYQMLLRVVEVRADAEDAVQETWLRAIAALGSFRWESAFQSWLIGIGLNVAHAMVRARRDDAPLPAELPAGASGAPETRLDLERALGRLPAGQRTVLMLHDVEGWTHEEIGRQLGMAPGTSKSQLFDARRGLRALLNPLAT
ncbi:MAG: RNA polymerase sigma factor [Gemmatimonadales bacterium]|nr:RNA polymerase sigma factor [Gemmatimonadales bacterium]